jgi:translation initiation factor 2B subunit (eIF-2B alpha/beta/delta family)
MTFTTSFLTQCRPLSISMGNAIKELKQLILHFDSEITDLEVNLNIIQLNNNLEKLIKIRLNDA